MYSVLYAKAAFFKSRVDTGADTMCIRCCRLKLVEHNGRFHGRHRGPNER